jgi:hypothetical protein
MGVNFRIVVHTHPSISSTGIDKTKYWSIILIYNIVIIFNIAASNIQLLQGQVIHATRSRPARRSSHVGFVRYISPGLRWKLKLWSLGIICSTLLFVFKIKNFIVLSYWRTTYLWKHPVRFLSIDWPLFDNRFLILTALPFTFTSYIRRLMFHCCYWCSHPSAFLISSWVIWSS